MRDYKQLLAERIETRQKAESDIEFRKEVFAKCAEDILYWMDMFAWTLNPKKDISQIPLILYEGKQVEYLRWMEDLLANPRDGFVDKPREVGATIITMNMLLYHFLFDEYFNARIGSRKEEYVDKSGNPDTLFYKIDYTIMRLPKWMLPEGFSIDKHRSHMRLMRPDNSNSIVGESANPNFGRGGRQSIVVFDEIGFWPFARSAWESAGDVSDIRLGMTTPPDTGKSSHAYKLYSQQAGEVETFEFNYSDIPGKDHAWLAKQKKRRSVEEFEREVLKSYEGTVEGKVYAGEWRLHVKEKSDLEYNPDLPLFVAWDFGINDPTAMIWLQKDYTTDKVYVIDYYEKNNVAIDFFIPFVTGEVISGINKYTEEDLEMIRLHSTWRKDITHYGDPDVVKRSLTDSESAHSILNQRGVYVQSKSWGKGKTHKDMKNKAMLLIRRLEVNQNRCSHFIECMVSARYPKKTENAQPTTESTKPVHDWTSHARSAFEYFADNETFKSRDQLEKEDNKKPMPRKKYVPKGGY